MMSKVDHGDITRRQALRRLAIAGTAMTLPGVLAACGSGSSGSSGDGSTAPNAGGRGTTAEIDSITWSIGPAPPSLDVASGFLPNGMLAMAVGLEGLLTIDDDLALKPLLAESWSQPDPLRYVYKLRSGVQFWDGSPLTAEDVAHSLGRHLDPKVGSQLASYFARVRSIAATGADEVTVRMATPDSLFQYVPVFCYVTPKALSTRLGKQLGAPGSTVTTMGTGPYEITGFSTGDGITVERNDRYWGTKPRVRRATLKFIQNPQTNVLAMRSGEIDGMFDFPLQRAKDWDRLAETSTQYAPGMRVAYLSFDMSAPPWDDPRVRRAVAYAADRKGFVDAFLGGHGSVADAIVAPVQWSGLASAAEVEAIYAKLPQYPFDLEKAKAELQQSAHADGFAATIEYPDVSPEGGQALVSLSETLKQLGIELEVKQVTQNQWLANILAHENLGLRFVLLSPDYADPADYPAIVFPSANAVRNNFNTANFKNPQVDRLLEQQARTIDKAIRARAVADMLQIAGEQLPYAPLWFQDSALAIDDRYVFPGFNSLYYNQQWLAKIQARA